MPKFFRFPGDLDFDALVPMQLNIAAQLDRKQMGILHAIGRVKAGISLDEAHADLARLLANAHRWKLDLPLKESEYTIAATANDKELFVATTDPTGEQVRIGLYRISNGGKLLQQSSIPGINVGLSFTGGSLLTFRLSPGHSVFAVRLSDTDLHIERESVLADLQEFVVPIKTTRTETWLIALRKDSTSVGLLVLNGAQQPESFSPLVFPMKPELLVSTVFNINFFAAGTDSLFMYSFPNDIADERVVAWTLPKR
jgi:hypothetical protein